MTHPLLEISRIDAAPRGYLAAVGRIFAVFDAGTQDSGNVSYGVRVGRERFFVKTAGSPADRRPLSPHSARVAALRNGARLWRACPHPALPRLRSVIDSTSGPLLVYDWIDGELLGARRERRSDRRSAFQRFRSLPAAEILAALDVVYELHERLARAGWVAVDFYDGCLLYDFERRELRVIDLDLYRDGPFTNDMGRMFGSSRFMAPEEFERGARIDQRTTVFTLGRAAAVLASDGSLERAPFRGGDALHAVVRRACRPDRDARPDSVAAFCAAWRAAR